MSKHSVPYLQWRDGRPRWEPGPKLRAAGHKGRDLKDARGQWLTLGPAIEQAKAINQAIIDGHTVELAGAGGPRSLSALFASLKASPRWREGPRLKDGSRIAPNTLKGYRAHLEILEAWGGDRDVAMLTPADIDILHDALREGRGLAMANAILRTLKLALNYARHKLRWIDANPAVGVKLPQTEGRLVMWTLDEIKAFVAAADWCGLDSMGDAQIIGLLTAQIRSDVISYAPLVEQDGVFRLARGKTGRAVFVPAIGMLTARLELARARNAAAFPNVAFTRELIDTTTGAPYAAEGSRFSDQHRMVRAVASGAIFAIEDIFRWMAGAPRLLRNLPFTPIAAIADKRFQDLRDTAVTFLFDAGCDIARIATITGHSLKTVQEILDKHYFVRNAGLARDAGVRLEALLAKNR